ncbi:hypothetical protein C1I95_12635 [Micromonospora craterilacus]|uniref:Uncharacterized protein n=1 Tax=Micromonospora craterilacus TaxID=1655439 RepID=A0A2W2EZ99_9ACTN|nr:hypothetical protein [Micromonospora craterilacus]PZG18900.1 hypothetical protein C1I95_12635 [Micromonospora craterilacus]
MVLLGLRWGLPLLWLVWAGLAWWSAPREVPAEQLERDAAAGRVVTAQRADGWTDEWPSFWGARTPPRVSQTGWLAVWTLQNGQVRYADIGPFVGPGPDFDTVFDDDSDESVPDADEVGFDDAGVTYPGSALDYEWVSLRGVTWGGEQGLAYRLSQAAVLAAAVIGLVWLAMVVGGPVPAAGTRWFWFWIGLLPLGLGVLMFWFRERRFVGHPEWQGRGDRSGWLGFGCLVFGGIALSLVLAGARALLGGFLVPG